MHRKTASLSITSPARVSSIGGTMMPSAFAVFKLITSSNLAAACPEGRPAVPPVQPATFDLRFTLASSLALRKHWPASQALRLLAITNPMPPRITSEDAVRRTVIPSPSTNAPPSAVITGTLNCTDAPCVGVRPGIAAYQIV
jgi:hypothetical protein